MKISTINDVALKSGVSKSTVSHVINGTRFVEEDTKQRVLQVIDELGYHPSSVARSLTTKRTQTIGVIVSDTSNNFFGELIRGIETVFRRLNYGLIVCNTDEQLEREEHYIQLLLSQQVDGIIAAATSQRWQALERADMKHKPIVFVDREFEGMNGRPYVGPDNERGAYLGTQHLITCGYKEIGVLAGFQRLSSMRDRLSGFRQALAEHQLQVPPDWVVTSSLSANAGREAALQILSGPKRPRALFANNNFLSLGALRAFKDLGLRCPDEVALVGFDDHPWAAVSNPPLTVVRQPVLDIGEKAAQLLLSLLNDKEPLHAKHLLDCELVVRKSCGSLE
jgi:LacI family transcriptional regulator